MSLWDRFRLLGEALQSNCSFKAPVSGLLRSTAGGLPVAAAPGRRTLRILSLNLWGSHFLGGPRRAERLQLVVEHLEVADYDLCVFQELFSFGFGPGIRLDGEARWLEQQLRDRGYGFSTVAATAATAPWVGQDSGLAAFSRLPLGQIAVDRFSNCRALSQKGVLRLQLATDEQGGGPVVEINTTHLEHSDKAKQAQQIQEVVAGVAVGETVILLHPPLPLGGVSIEMMRECQQHDSLANG